ncbi:MAG: glycosyltransferase [Beijerinckiaceae bacterium]|nr:glycosyltransferase [Beijerinckiaceae bacterium]
MTGRSLVFVWEKFAPIHVDRCDAVARAAGNGRRVVGIELASQDRHYDWLPEASTKFGKTTLFFNTTVSSLPLAKTAFKLIRECWRNRPADFFFCHYELAFVFFAALILRITGNRVFIMNDSKFDDRKRYLWREVMKSVLLIPYNGSIASGRRAEDYFRFLGIPEKGIRLFYDTLSTERIRRLGAVAQAPGGTPFESRHFTVVARMVPKKNISMVIEAFALYRAQSAMPRQLQLCGSGPLEAQLRSEAAARGLEESVIFRGVLQMEDVCKTLGTTLALLLPSTEEQFGNVVIEAQALGLPVILSDNCGARDMLVRGGVNGFVIEPDNPAGLAFFMGLLDRDESLWRRMSLATRHFAELGDASLFAKSVLSLAG